MASPYTTTTEIAGPINNIFMETLLRNAKAHCPYYAGSMPATVGIHQGTFTAKWRRIENLTPTTTALSELTGNLAFPTRDAVQASVTDYTATVLKYGNHYLLSEEVDLINVNGQAKKLVETLGINAGSSLNRLQRNELEDNSTLVQAAGAANDAATTTALAAADVRNVVNILNRNSAVKYTGRTTGSTSIGTSPIRSAFLGICHYDVEEDVRDMTGFIASESYASQTQLYQNEFGAFGGVRFVSTEEGGIDADTGGANAALRGTTNPAANIDLYTTVIYGMDYHGSLGLDVAYTTSEYTAGDELEPVEIILHARGSAGAADPMNEISTLGWKAWHAAKILNATWGRGIRSGATALA